MIGTTEPVTGYAQGTGNIALPPNALTIDVEDYYHVSGFSRMIRPRSWEGYRSRVEFATNIVLDLLAETPSKGTFFVLGWVADRYPKLIRRIVEEGHEVGCHGYWHQLVYRQLPATFRNDLRLARRVIEDASGSAICAFRAPSFSIDASSLWALDVLIEEGFTIDSSIFPIKHDRYGINHSPGMPYQMLRRAGMITEIPLSVVKWFQFSLPVGGGGYFRMMPYAMNRRFLAELNREGRPAVVYLHPWEFDPQQPRIKGGFLSNWRHYLNIGKTASRFARLLKDFSFGTVSQLAGAHRTAEPEAVVV